LPEQCSVSWHGGEQNVLLLANESDVFLLVQSLFCPTGITVGHCGELGPLLPHAWFWFFYAQILERLRKEDDEVVDTWYLAGWLAHITNDTDFAIECLDKYGSPDGVTFTASAVAMSRQGLLIFDILTY
jgi:hypothetical protein